MRSGEVRGGAESSIGSLTLWIPLWRGLCLQRSGIFEHLPRLQTRGCDWMMVGVDHVISPMPPTRRASSSPLVWDAVKLRGLAFVLGGRIEGYLSLGTRYCYIPNGSRLESLRPWI